MATARPKSAFTIAPSEDTEHPGVGANGPFGQKMASKAARTRIGGNGGYTAVPVWCFARF